MLLLSPVIQGAQINEAACNMAREVADEGDALVAGGVSQTPCYMETRSETQVKAIFKKQLDDFLKKDIDFYMAEVRLCHEGNAQRDVPHTHSCWFDHIELKLYITPFITHLYRFQMR